jgi:aspartate/methionine/tyrosine aminotransferase
MKLASHLKYLGTETAFAVSDAAADWQKRGNKVYPFHLGDINIPTPANIVEAATRAISDGHTGYCPGAGIPELREAIAMDVGEKRQLSYSAENVSVQPGGKPVIGKFLLAVMNRGDEVLYPNPGYPIYESQIEFQGGVAVPYGFVESVRGFELDIDALRASITDKTRILIYNNYQNPTGAQSSAHEMEQVAALALAYDLIVLADEAYFEIQYAGEPRSIVSIPGMQERTVILYTCSKRFAMTGWRLGAAIGPKLVIDVISKLNTNAESCTTHFIQRAMVEAIRGDTSGPDEIVKVLRARRDAAVKGLNAIDGINVASPDSTFYLFANVTAVMERKGLVDVNEFMTQVLTETNVSCCTRKHFGKPVRGEMNQYLRFAYSGINSDDIVAGLGHLKQFFEG